MKLAGKNVQWLNKLRQNVLAHDAARKTWIDSNTRHIEAHKYPHFPLTHTHKNTRTHTRTHSHPRKQGRAFTIHDIDITCTPTHTRTTSLQTRHSTGRRPQKSGQRNYTELHNLRQVVAHHAARNNVYLFCFI